jgi:glutamate dehydrogenase/leucine dehydrogenase
MREPIENELWKKGILIVPDFIANAGGVISSYAEYKGYTPKQMFKMVEEKITESTRAVLKESLARKENPRITGMKLAMAKVQKHSIKKGV